MPPRRRRGPRVAVVVAAALLGSGALVSLLVAEGIERAYPPGGPFVAVEGGRIATLQAGPEVGEGPPIVLLHGAGGNASDLMESVGRSLAAAGRRVIALDRPGLGWSERVAGAATPRAQAEIVAQALARIDARPAILVGHSWGGALALALAIDHPGRVAGLLLIAPVALPPDAPPRWIRTALLPPLAWIASRTLGPAAAVAALPMIERMAFAPQPPAERYLARSRAALALRPAAMRANLEDLAGLPEALAEQAPRYAGLRLPVTIVAGDADPIVGTAGQAVPLAEAIPGARLVLLPGLGHMVPWLAPEVVVAEAARLAGATGR